VKHPLHRYAAQRLPREGTVVARTARLSRTRLIPAIGTVLALALTGCAAGQIPQTAQQVAAVDGANGTAGPLGVRHVVFAKTDDGSYQVGSDAPLLLWVSNAAITADTLTAVSTPVADNVEISGSAVFEGQTLVEVGSATPLKITVTGLKEEIPAGHSMPVTFTFKAAGPITVNVPVEIPGDRGTEPRETVNILPAEPGNIWFGEHGAEPSAEG
jgi:copper(I)-binding protein